MEKVVQKNSIPKLWSAEQMFKNQDPDSVSDHSQNLIVFFLVPEQTFLEYFIKIHPLVFQLCWS